MTIETVFKNEFQSYKVKYSVKDYRFPTADIIESVRLNESYIHLELVDGRILSIPLDWIPPLRDASPEERMKFHITADRDAIFWDPDEGTVNEILRVADYLCTRHIRP